MIATAAAHIRHLRGHQTRRTVSEQRYHHQAWDEFQRESLAVTALSNSTVNATDSSSSIGLFPSTPPASALGAGKGGGAGGEGGIVFVEGKVWVCLFVTIWLMAGYAYDAPVYSGDDVDSYIQETCEAQWKGLDFMARFRPAPGTNVPVILKTDVGTEATKNDPYDYISQLYNPSRGFTRFPGLEVAANGKDIYSLPDPLSNTIQPIKGIDETFSIAALNRLVVMIHVIDYLSRDENKTEEVILALVGAMGAWQTWYCPPQVVHLLRLGDRRVAIALAHYFGIWLRLGPMVRWQKERRRERSLAEGSKYGTSKMDLEAWTLANRSEIVCRELTGRLGASGGLYVPWVLDALEERRMAVAARAMELLPSQPGPLW